MVAIICGCGSVCGRGGGGAEEERTDESCLRVDVGVALCAVLRVERLDCCAFVVLSVIEKEKAE